MFCTKFFHICSFHSAITSSFHICDWASEKGPSWHKYTTSQNGKYLEFCVQYLLSINKYYTQRKLLAIKLFIDGKNFTSIALADE